MKLVFICLPYRKKICSPSEVEVECNVICFSFIDCCFWAVIKEDAILFSSILFNFKIHHLNS